MIFPGFPGVLSFFQVFQVKWEPWLTLNKPAIIRKWLGAPENNQQFKMIWLSYPNQVLYSMTWAGKVSVTGYPGLTDYSEVQGSRLEAQGSSRVRQ